MAKSRIFTTQRSILVLCISAVVLCFGLFSCNKWIFDKDQASNDPYQNFDYLWQEINDKYSYLELKELDWSTIKTKYRSQIHAGMNEEALFEVLKKMLLELRDDHSNLVSTFDVASYNIYGKKPHNFDQHLIYQLFPDLQRTGPFSHSLVPNTNVVYVRYGSFLQGFSDEQLDYLLSKYKDTEGMIFDVRENGGGSASNVPALLERFCHKSTLAGYFITKNGPGAKDFGDREVFQIHPSKHVRYLKPIAVLTDRGSYSATTFFSLATKQFDNITLVGDTTGGGAGLPNGGQLPNGWTYRFSITQTLYPNGDNSAEAGVVPDILQFMNFGDPNQDAIINRALTFLQNQ